MYRDYFGDLYRTLPLRFKTARFKDFGPYGDLAPDETPLYYNFLTPYEQAVADALLDFTNLTKRRELQITAKGVILAGDVGVGKTHMLCSAANWLHCEPFRTFVVWTDVYRTTPRDLGLSLDEYIKFLMEFGFLFIDDLKLDDDFQVDLLTGLITKLYNNVNHPGFLLTFNTHYQKESQVKQFLLERVPLYVADRIEAMFKVYVLRGASRRKPQS